MSLTMDMHVERKKITPYLYQVTVVLAYQSRVSYTEQIRKSAKFDVEEFVDEQARQELAGEITKKVLEGLKSDVSIELLDGQLTDIVMHPKVKGSVLIASPEIYSQILRDWQVVYKAP